MDFSQILIGWVVLSVPVSLLIGAFVSLGSKGQQAIPVPAAGRSTRRQASGPDLRRVSGR